ncbi:MAG: TROVE domain-containing protein [Prevotellaceae bacterium]|nr:TROVE domain-containing protein [Prevotellaceae bacterium]
MRFNETTKETAKTLNYEGAKAYKMSPEMELYSAVVTCMVDDSYYEAAEERLVRIRELIGKCKPEFTAKLAVYARTAMNMRSIPVVLAVELAKISSGNDLVQRLVSNIVRRADEITEVLAYYQTANERTETKKLNRLSKQLQKGLQQAFNRFDEYQFAKYNRDTAVKLRDALFIVHPKAKDGAQQQIFNKIVDNKLDTPYTWETELSALGQQNFENAEAKAAAFRAKWEELLDSGKVGYMALLRNIRNILQANVSAEHVKELCKALSFPDAVRKSKQLPFRFLSAYRETSKIENGFAPQIMDALEKAAAISSENIAGFDENTRVVVACDVSGSMQCTISQRSSIQNYDIGLMLGMLLKNRCKNVISGIFGNTWKVVNLPSTCILSNVDAFYKREGEVGYSTNGYLVVKDLLDRKLEMNKIFIFTDCQMWNSRGDGETMQREWSKYKKICPQAKLYLFDLSGYGNTPLNIAEKDVYLLAGWSDKVFDTLAALEKGENGLAEINKIVL